MAPRNKHLGKQLRTALRDSRWSADVIAFRTGLSRAVMARVLVGDTDISLRILEKVADELGLSVDFKPWGAVGQPPAPGRIVETVVDRARARLMT